MLKIYGEICDNEWAMDGYFGIQDLEKWLAENPDGDIVGEIRSPGGSVEQGLMIYDRLRASGRNITFTAFQCSSIASIIFLAADKRIISSNCMPLIHHPALMPWDLDGRLTSNDLEQLAEYLKQYEDRILSIYSERMGIDPKNIEIFRSKMLNEWEMTADDAILWGLATEKLSSNVAAVKLKAVAYSDKVNNILNMNIFKELKDELASLKGAIKALGKPAPKMGQISTTSETIAILYFEGDQIETGMTVYSDSELTTVAPAGTYETVDGQTITVDDSGAVAAITEDGGMDAEAIKKMQEEMEALKAENADLKTKCEAQAKAIESKAKEYESLATKVEKALKMAEEASKKTTPSPEAKKHEDKKTRVFGTKIN